MLQKWLFSISGDAVTLGCTIYVNAKTSRSQDKSRQGTEDAPERTSLACLPWRSWRLGVQSSVSIQPGVEGHLPKPRRWEMNLKKDLRNHQTRHDRGDRRDESGK